MKDTIDGKMCTIPDYPAVTAEERLRRLEDRRAVEECIFHYTRCSDRFDAEGMASCFTARGKLRWGPDGTPFTGGREALADYFRTLVGRAVTQSHFVTNQQVLFLAEDRAVGECNVYSWQIWKEASLKTTYCFGRYEYLALREPDGEWRLDSLTLILNGKLAGDEIVDGRCAEQLSRPWPPEGI